jgi:hypothetical protein
MTTRAKDPTVARQCPLLVWIAWRMIGYKTAAVLQCAASQQAPGSDACKSSPRPTFPADHTEQPDR